jgi:WD40 repeat protein
MTFIEQWQDQLPDSLFNFAKLKLEVGDTDFGTAHLAAAVLWPIRQALRNGDEEAIHALGQIVGLNQVDLVQQAVGGWEDDPLEAVRSLSARAADDPRLDKALTALTEYFNAPALFAEQLAQAASQMSPVEEPRFERYTPHPAEFEALAAAVVAGQAPETVRLPLDEIDEKDELAVRVKDLLYRVIKTYIDQVKSRADDPQPADDPVLRRLGKELAESAWVLRGCETENDMLATLVSRLAHLPELVPLTEALTQSLTPPYLTLRHPPLDLAHPALRHILSGHSSPVDGCAITPDGATIVSASWDDTLKVWDAASGDERLTLTGHSDSVDDCAISADGSIIVSASSDKTLKVWAARTGDELMTLAGHTDIVEGCAISADGATVVSASRDETLKVWDARTGAERFTLTGHVGHVMDCDISPDGSAIVSAGTDGTLRVWDARNRTQRFSLEHTQHVSACAISADGATLLSASSNTVKVWDAHSGARRFTLKHPYGVADCAISADGSTIVSAASSQSDALLYLDGGHYNLLKVWDARTGAERSTLTGHTSMIWSCAISADGRYVVSAAGDLLSMAFDHTVRVWDLHEDARPLLPARQTASAVRCEISADGAVAISYSFEEGLTVWDPQSMAERYTLPGRWGSALSADGVTIISRDRDETLKVWDARGGTQRATLAGQSNSIVDCAISGDGDTLFAEGQDETLKVWDTKSGRERFTLSGHDSPLRRFAISADGAVAVSASQDCEIKVWDALSGTERLTIATERGLPGDCAVSPDGTLICVTSIDHLSGSHPKPMFKVWDAHTGAERFSLTGHEWEIRGCAFSHDGGLIVSAARDGTLKVWDAGSGACLTTLGGLGPLYDCACSSYGQHVMAVGSDGVSFLRLVR